MAKRKPLQPWPETIWHSRGRLNSSQALQVIRQHLQQHPVVHWREYTPESEEWWWGFDATWRTPSGERIKARLELQPDSALRAMGLTKERLEAREKVEMAWVLTAEADHSWDLSWPSPLTTMLGDVRTYDVSSGQFAFSEYTAVREMTTQDLRHWLQSMSAITGYITVLTHDMRPVKEVKLAKEPSLVDMLPPSLRGRVLEIRLFDHQERLANTREVLPESRLGLWCGGALILPTKPRQDQWNWDDYEITRPSGGDMEQLLKETAETVVRYAQLQPHSDDHARWCVQDLRKTWELPEIEQAPARVLLEKKRTEEQVMQLQGVLQELRGELGAEQRARAAAEESARQVQEQLRRLAQSVSVQRIQDLEAQNEVAWRVQESTDAHAEKLTGEVAYLRRLLAQVPGHSYDEPVPERTEGPLSWEELLELAGELLSKVRLLDCVAESVKKLRGHANEKTWLRRTWDALEAYQAYAEAKETQGPEVLPHMQAYLRWELAESLFPESWHAPKEAGLLRRDPKYAAMRTFTVEGHGRRCSWASTCVWAAVGLRRRVCTSSMTRRVRPARSTSATSARTCRTVRAKV
jgi:hypothetical protein